MPKLSPAGYSLREFLLKQSPGYRFTIPFLAAQLGFPVVSIQNSIGGLKEYGKVQMVERKAGVGYRSGSPPATWEVTAKMWDISVDLPAVRAALDLQSVMNLWVVKHAQLVTESESS